MCCLGRWWRLRLTGQRAAMQQSRCASTVEWGTPYDAPVRLRFEARSQLSALQLSTAPCGCPCVRRMFCIVHSQGQTHFLHCTQHSCRKPPKHWLVYHCAQGKLTLETTDMETSHTASLHPALACLPLIPVYVCTGQADLENH